MRTSPTITKALERFAEAVYALNRHSDATAGDTWQMRCLSIDDAARRCASEVSHFRLWDPAHTSGPGTRGDEAYERVAGVDWDRVRACERVLHAAPWLVSALRVANMSRRPLPTADQYAEEAMRLLGDTTTSEEAHA